MLWWNLNVEMDNISFAQINHCFVSCDLVEDNCDPNPCHNGICENQIGGYLCQCSQGYTGRNCETGKHYDIIGTRYRSLFKQHQ